MPLAQEIDTVPSFPERVGRYDLLLPLGTGGMATVFLARTRGVGGFQRDVALKLLHAHLRADEESKLHLLEEAKLAAKIRHPNVVPVLEVGEDPYGLYLVMDYVEGETLSGLLEVLRRSNASLPSRIAARIVLDALQGLHAAHELRDEGGAPLGLVHRDFSPQNLLIGIDGVTRLTDFGVAKAAGRAVRTKTGLVKGKVAYMAPEQARGHAVDRRCDVWAAGIIAWELISGERLHDHPDDVATLLSVVTEEPPLLSDVMDDVPPELDRAVASALSTPLETRCGSAEELRRRLEAAWLRTGGVADQHELGQFVTATLGPTLSRRRERITQLRAGGGDSATTALGMGSVPVSIASPERAPVTSEQTATGTALLRVNEEKATLRRTWLSASVAVVVVAGAAVAAAWAASSPGPAAAEAPAAARIPRPPPREPIVSAIESTPPEPAFDEREDTVDLEQAAAAETAAPVRKSKSSSPAPKPRNRATPRPPNRETRTTRGGARPRALPESRVPKQLAADPYGKN